MTTAVAASAGPVETVETVDAVDDAPRWWPHWCATLFGPLFPRATSRPVSRRGMAVAALAVLAATVVSLLRTTGTGPLQSIWEEDARDILTDAYALPAVHAIFKPAVGYFLIGPRLLGELAAMFPVSWAAAVLSISSALVTALFALAVYVASGAHFTSRLARLLVAAPLLTSPVGENWLSEIYNRPVCLHFFGLYTVFWMLLWVPASRWGRVAALAAIAFTAFSSIVVVAYVPLALLRLYVRRDRTSVAMLGVVASATALHLAGLQFGLTGRGGIGGMRLDPVWALGNYVVWAVPHSLLGYRATSDLIYLPHHLSLVVSRNLIVIALSWLLIIGLVAAAVLGRRRGLLRPAWPLAALAAVYSVGLSSLMIMANGGIAMRYLLPVELLLFVALVALVQPAREVAFRRAGALLVAFAVFVAVISAFNYRWNDTYRARAPHWTDQVRMASARCQADPALGEVIVRGGPQPFWSIVIMPCHQLRLRPAGCPPPGCTYLDPPRVSLPAPAGRSTLARNVSVE